MTNHLASVTTAAREYAEAYARLRHATACAVNAGAPVTDVAIAAGVGRPTVYRWVAESNDPAVDVIWRGERVRVEPSGVPLRIDWRAVAETLTELPVQDAGIDGPDVRDLEPGQATDLVVHCKSGSQPARTLRYRVERAQ